MNIIIAIAGLAVGIAVGYLIRVMMGRMSASSNEAQAKQVLENARRSAESIVKESEIQAKAEVIKAREEFEKSTDGRKKEIAAAEERLAQRELNLDRKVALIDKKEKAIEEKNTELEQKSVQLEKDKAEVQKLAAEEREKLQKIAGMSQDEAKKLLLQRVEKEVHNEVGSLIRHIQEGAKETAEREARRIIAMAIQRYGASHANEMITSTVVLPSEDMKGRIIGRDGRNIRSLEAMTGVNILIDDTPEAVVVSGFDPIRREIAKQSLEQLINDGRIHPARIEEIVAKIKDNMEETIRIAGEKACYGCGVQGVDPEIVRMIGRLNFRTSYTQNVLQHSIEVSNLMGIMAGELGLDVSIAKRAGLFHDIGKAMDHEVEGGHAVIGADLLKRHGENAVIVNAVAAHHEEVPSESLYAILASAADAISSSRLGARAETTDIYIKRLEKIETIANGFEGVSKSYAIHAGREVRVLVEPEKIDDNGAMVLARNISKKIEADLQYPGQIRVTVIRETRAVEYAK